MAAATRTRTIRKAGRDVQMVEADGIELTERAYDFTRHFVEGGGGNATKCALAAGYPEGSAASMASLLLRDERVLALIDTYARTRLRIAVAAAAYQIEQIVKTGSLGDAVKLKACESVLDRASKVLAKIERTETKVTVEHKVPDGASALTSIKRMVEDSGMALVIKDEAKHARWLDNWDRVARGLGDGGTITDAVYEEIEDKPAGLIGLEDVV